MGWKYSRYRKKHQRAAVGVDLVSDFFFLDQDFKVGHVFFSFHNCKCVCSDCVNFIT